MSDDPTIREMTSDGDIASTFAVMRQLRPHLVSHEYVPAVRRMMAAQGFKLAGVIDGSGVRAVAGYVVAESLAWGRHLYVHDLVTGESERSRGHGKLLLDWLKDEARASGCAELHLDSGVQRHGAHRFYLRERMDISAYHFRLKIEGA
jgi:GNAT superfamily N-acetyltransferase